MGDAIWTLAAHCVRGAKTRPVRTVGRRTGADGRGPETARGTWALGRVAAGGAARSERGGSGRRGGGRLLRVGFGLLWILDGILQAQPKMAGGLAAQVIEPSAAASPVWVQHVVNWGGAIWSFHPIQSGAASVWIQVGIGLWLLVAKSGPWSRLAGLASRGLGPGGVGVRGVVRRDLLAGAELADRGARGRAALRRRRGAGRPARAGLAEPAHLRRLGRLLLGGIGLFFIGMAVLQAWPGRGFWKGRIDGKPGTLSGMVQQMSGTPQPHVLSALLARFGSFWPATASR